MIKVISFFFEKGKLYREGTIITDFTKKQEDKRIKLKQAIKLEKKEVKPSRSKKEK